ncbi:MAG: hypothetical protein R3E89_13980 [Thiolinea sp.]
MNTGEMSPIASNAWDGYCASVIAQAGVRFCWRKVLAAAIVQRLPELYWREG